MTTQTRQQKEQAMARKGRLVALAIAGTMVIWLAGTSIVPAIGLPARFVFLFDLAALAAFIWIFVNIWQMWRLRQDLNDNTPNSGQR